MSEEIEETLDDIKRHLDYVEATKQSSIRDNEIKIMYEYITSLQQKVEHLENIKKGIKDYIEKDKLNIDESQCYVETQTGWKMIPEIYDDLLNILNKGSEDNE